MFASIAVLALPLLAQLAGAAPAAEADAYVELEARHRSNSNWVNYGCHFDCYDGMKRHLPTLAFTRPDNSPDKCIRECRKKGFKVAGLQFGNECWCGNEIAGQLTYTKECTSKCKNGDNCGGPCRNMVWGVPGLPNTKQLYRK